MSILSFFLFITFFFLKTLLKIGEIVDEIIKQTDLGKRKTFSLDKLDSLVQELKKYGIYWDLKQVYDR